MKRNGFVFIESVIVLMVVALSLTMLISSYSLITRKTQEKEYYDRASDKYLLYSITNIGVNDECNYNLANSCGYEGINLQADEKNCNNTRVGKLLYNCSQTFKDMNIKHIYVVDDIKKELSKDNAVEKYDNGVIEYMKTLKKCNDADSNTCEEPISYMIGVFYRSGNYYYASLKIDAITEECEEGYYLSSITKKCERIEYVIKFDKQEGSGGTNSIKVSTGNKPGNISIPSKTGYTFLGYYTEENGGGDQYYDSDGKALIVFNQSQNITLYAHYIINYLTYESLLTDNKVNGALKGSLRFDGTSDYHNVGLANYNFNNTVTLAVKLVINNYTYPLNSDPAFIGNWDGYGLGLAMNYKNYTSYFNIWNANTNAFDINIGPNLEALKEYTVVGTYDGNNIKLYINGLLANTVSRTQPFSSSTTNMTLGASQTLTGEYRAFLNSNIKAYAVFDDVITSLDDIKNIFNDDTIKNKYSNLKYWKFDGVGLDGKDDYINLGFENKSFGKNISLVTSFSLNDNNSGMALLGDWEVGGGGIYVSSNKLCFDIYNPNAVVCSNTTIEKEKRYIVVATYDGTDMKLYLNGKLENTTKREGEFNVSTVPFGLGADIDANGAHNFLRSNIYQALIYNRTLTEDEIKNNFSNEINVTNGDELLRYVDFTK